MYCFADGVSNINICLVFVSSLVSEELYVLEACVMYTSGRVEQT